jgi:hypothetical protein
MLWNLFVLPLRIAIVVECAILFMLVAPFLLIGRLFGLIEPADLPS